MPTGIKITSSLINDICKKYQEQPITITQMSKIFGLCTVKISEILKKNGIKLYAREECVNKMLNENYFEVIDSAKKAYFYGFLIKKCTIYKKRLCIAVSKYNFQLLKELLKELNCESTICEDNRHTPAVFTQIVSSKLCKSLSEVMNINKISVEYRADFFRGIIEANGICKEICLKNKFVTKLVILNKDISFLSYIQQAINDYYNIKGIIDTTSYVRDALVYNNEDIKILFNTLYNNATVYSEEFYKKFKELSHKQNLKTSVIESIFIDGKEALLKATGTVQFYCEECGKLTSRQIRSDRPYIREKLLCKQCSQKFTCLEKYGVVTNLIIDAHPKETWAKKHDEIIAKTKKTCLEKYGCEHHTQNKEIQEKAKRTKIKNNSYEKQKISSAKTKLERYGDPNYHNIEMFKDSVKKAKMKFEQKYNCTSLTTLLKTYGQGFLSLNLPIIKFGSHRNFISNQYLDTIKKYASENHSVQSMSKEEKELVDYIKSIYEGKVLENTRSILKDKSELDIYLPDLKIAIEFNGIYWHSIEHKDKYYHQNKSLACYQQGIRLAHVFESDWIYNNTEIKDKLKRLICMNESFNDGTFPILNYDKSMKFSEPSKHMFDKYAKEVLDESQCKNIVYDTGVLQ